MLLLLRSNCNEVDDEHYMICRSSVELAIGRDSIEKPVGSLIVVEKEEGDGDGSCGLSLSDTSDVMSAKTSGKCRLRVTRSDVDRSILRSLRSKIEWVFEPVLRRKLSWQSKKSGEATNDGRSIRTERGKRKLRCRDSRAD